MYSLKREMFFKPKRILLWGARRFKFAMPMFSGSSLVTISRNTVVPFINACEAKKGQVERLKRELQMY